MLWLLNADANGSLGIRHRKVEVERLKAAVKWVRKIKLRFNHENVHK